MDDSDWLKQHPSDWLEQHQQQTKKHDSESALSRVDKLEQQVALLQGSTRRGPRRSSVNAVLPPRGCFDLVQLATFRILTFAIGDAPMMLLYVLSLPWSLVLCICRPCKNCKSSTLKTSLLQDSEVAEAGMDTAMLSQELEASLSRLFPAVQWPSLSSPSYDQTSIQMFYWLINAHDFDADDAFDAVMNDIVSRGKPLNKIVDTFKDLNVKMKTTVLGGSKRPDAREAQARELEALLQGRGLSAPPDLSLAPAVSLHEKYGLFVIPLSVLGNVAIAVVLALCGAIHVSQFRLASWHGAFLLYILTFLSSMLYRGRLRLVHGPASDESRDFDVFLLPLFGLRIIKRGSSSQWVYGLLSVAPAAVLLIAISWFGRRSNKQTEMRQL